jgi:predicted nucleic acid-binding protein
MKRLRAFLDANVLFSAAYKEDSSLLEFWKADKVSLVSSEYAVIEARRNLAMARPDALARLDTLTGGIEIINEEFQSGSQLVEEIKEINSKDRPLIEAAVRSKCSFFITGDWKHFEGYFEKTINGVMILTPAQFFKAYAG